MPKDPIGLSATALIEEQDGEYLVWLCHDNPQDHPDNHSFVAGSFDSFDAAVAALLDVRGLTIDRILSGAKRAEDDAVEVTFTVAKGADDAAS